MTGLKVWKRDAGLPERLGDPGCNPPEPSEVGRWIGRHLADEQTPPVRATALEFARWKPSVSITCVYRVEFADGSDQLVALKRYQDDKASHLAERQPARPMASKSPGVLKPRAAVDAHTVMWVPSADRRLPGLARILDPRRTARWLQDGGLVPERSVRRRRTSCALLRYKPERRAVVRCDVALRTEPRTKRSFALRALPVAEARRISLARAGLTGSAPVIPLALAIPDAGVIIEPWLDIRPFEDDSFDHAEEAGRALAILHDRQPRRTGLTGDVIHGKTTGARELLARFGIDPNAIPAPNDEPSTTVHGDFHPGQVALDESDQVLLLDLDELDVGDPLRDLASWIADHLAVDPDVDLERAAAPLLSGYRSVGGMRVDVAKVAPFVADELVARAGGCIRRLEVGALNRARHLVRRAEDIRSPAIVSLPACELRTALEALRHFGGATASSVVRVDLTKKGAVHLCLEARGGERWVALADGRLHTLAPEDDEKIPLTRGMETRANCAVLAYRPGRRIVLRDGDRVLKGYRAGRDAGPTSAHATAIDINRQGGFRVPALIRVLSEEAAIELELVEGTPIQVRNSEQDHFEEIGRRLRAMQSSPSEGLQAFGASDELSVLSRWRSRTSTAGVNAPSGWDAALVRMHEANEELPAFAPAPCHRDLHDGQFLATQDGVLLLDFDLLCAADPALDAGNLAAHLELRALQRIGGATPAAAELCRTAFLAGLDRDREDTFAERLHFYEATAFLRLVLVYALRPRWCHLSPTLLDLGLRAISRDVRSPQS